MNAKFLAPLVGLLALAGCRSGALVVVTVDAQMPLDGVVKLHNTAIAGGRSHVFDIAVSTASIPPSRVYGIDVPPDISGTLTLTVDAVDAAGTTLATRQGSTTLNDGARSDIAIDFAATTVADLAASGVSDMSNGADLGSGALADLAQPADLTVVRDLSVGLTTFEFIVDNIVQSPLTCPSANWEFNAPLIELDGGVGRAVIKNTSLVPLAYNARSSWNFGVHYAPGVAVGDGMEVVGVLQPSESIDISSQYSGGITALLGSSAAFSNGSPQDETTIQWPSGVAGSNGGSTMFVAEIEVRASCNAVSPVW